MPLASSIVSGVLGTLPAFGTLAGESLWLITPHNNSAKLAGRSQINNLYGAFCGIRPMNYVDGCMGVFMMVPLIVGVWMFSSPVAALVSTLCLAAAGPFLATVGVFLTLIPPMGGVEPSTAVVFAVFNLLLGGNMAWRTLDPGFLVPEKYAPVIAAWHALCMLIYAVYASHFLSYAPKLKYSMKLEKMKDDSVAAGSTWIRGEPSPVGFGEGLKKGEWWEFNQLVATAAKEQAEVPITPLWRLALELLVLVGGLVGAVPGAVLYVPDDLTPFPARNCAYASLVLSLVGTVALVVIFQKAAKGAFGTQEMKELV